ncbi:hypothetical protein DSM43518_01302 [Mycobacterium marinum]|uniref:DUF7159 family protein n=1 Tax=Mycobacterium marinum TaxID=1781 RepID=UPI000E28AE79|nr:hypothetical protein MM1218R_00564 [Mycobacterium marinum]RFZ08248.1 hypothetical protein DE4381_02465 [Mycobacterium marinum]RFZ13447.1 hypothetical protein DSM43518_01302 [Mycobacterium marinum]
MFSSAATVVGCKTLGGVLDVVLGVSMAAADVRMALVEGEDGDGLIVEEDSFDLDRNPVTSSASDQVVAAILGTREGAADAGLRLSSIGVTWTDPVQAAALRDALAWHKVENVMLVSGFLAAAALGQAVGGALSYARTAVLFIEPDTATLAVVDTADGSVSEVRQQLLAEDDDAAVAEVVAMVAAAESLPARPDGVYVVGTGVDVAMIKPALDAATSLTVSVSEEQEMALARGAALACGNAPLFAATTAALAYAQDLNDPDPLGESDLGDEFSPDQEPAGRRSGLLIGSGLAVVATAAVVALEVALAIDIRPTVALQPRPNENHLVAPPPQAAPPPQVAAPEPKIELPRPRVAPRAASPQLPAPAAPVQRAPEVPVLPAPTAPEPVVAVPPLVPIVVPPVRVPSGVDTFLRPSVPNIQAPVPRQQPKVPAPRVEVPASPPPVVSPNPRGRGGLRLPGLGRIPNPGRGPAGGSLGPGRRGHFGGGAPGRSGPSGGGHGGQFGGGGHGGGFGGGRGGGGHGGGFGGFGGGHGGGGHGGGFGGGHGGGFGGGHGGR